jgi:drug/metabolite transporter (DMT)-like permease
VGRPQIPVDAWRRDARSEEPGGVILYLSLAMVSSALLALGLLMMKSRSDHLPIAAGANIIGAIIAWIRDPMWIGGLGVQTVGWAMYVIAVSRAPVSMVAVMMQGGIALFVVASVVILGERARLREWIGIGAIVFGMVMLALSALLLALGLAPAGVARLKRSGAAAAIFSGVVFGLAGLFTKAMTENFLGDDAGPIALRIATNPYVYGVIAANIAGIVTLQNSFHSARGIIAMPLSSALSNVVPIAGGMLAFGEHLPSDQAATAMRIGAFILTIAAGALLAGAREQSPGAPVVARAAAESVR